MQMLLLRLLSSLHHFENGYCTAEISSELQHFFVRRLVVLSVLPGLHLFDTATEGDVGVVRVSRASRLFRPHGRYERILLK